MTDKTFKQNCDLSWCGSMFTKQPTISKKSMQSTPTGLSLSFNSLVALIFTPVANLLLYGFIVHVSTTCTGQLTRNIKGPSAVTGATGYGPY